jgi:hypothetical protein
MKNYAKSLVNSSVSLAASIVFFSALAAPLRAQGGGRNASPTTIHRNAEQDMMSREWNLTHIPDAVNGQFKKEEVSIFHQVQEDFTLIQVVNNKMVKTVFLDKSLDYRLISATTEEIRKRALRLKGNLLLPKSADKEKGRDYRAPSNDEQLKAALLTLDSSIMSFVSNPLFKMPNVIDPDLASKAGHDLESIIEFSDAIRKNVQNLSKPDRRAH